MLDTDQVRAEEEQLRRLVRELSDSKRAEFFRMFNQQVKDPDTYAVMNYLLITGIHHFYLRKWFRGAINLFIFCAALGLMFSGLVWPGIIIIGVVVVSELYALFRSQLIVQDYNNQLMRHLLDTIKNKSVTNADKQP